MILQLEPLIGIIYLYIHRQTGKPLYVGQTIHFKRRDRDHFYQKERTVDRKLQKIGRDNIITIKLHEKTFNEFEDSKKNREVYQLWANELEIYEIEKHDTYNNGLNGTIGGHKTKNESYIEYHHKEATKTFKKLIKASKIYNEKERSGVGGCPRNYIVSEMGNYKLGEKIHQFRRHHYATIWADPKCVKLLNEVGYTNTSAEAGVNRMERASKTRLDNNWPKIEEVLKWVYNKYGHININQEADNPSDFPEKLLEGLNYKRIGCIIQSLRHGCIIGNNKERKEFLDSVEYFQTKELFIEHQFLLGLKWYYQNYPYSFPRRNIIIPNGSGLPKYMADYHLGEISEWRKCKGKIPDEAKKLIEMNKDKPLFTMKEYWKNHPDEYGLMRKKSKEKRKIKSPLFYTIRSYKNILKTEFQSLQFTDLKTNNTNSKHYAINQTKFTEKKRKTIYFCINKYEERIECYNAARKYKIMVFYARKWYIKSKIKKLELEYSKEQY